MLKIGVKKIGFVKKGRLSDSIFDRTNDLTFFNTSQFIFISFVQDSAVLTDETVDDDKGVYHRITVDFTTRQDLDEERQKIESFIGKPIIILVLTVDGSYYLIGNNDEPAYITHRDTYNRLQDRNVQTTCEYINLDGLVTINASVSGSSTHVSVNRSVVVVPWQGGSGNIFVESDDEWNVQILNS